MKTSVKIYILTLTLLGAGAAQAARTGPWPKEKAWAWYNAQPWIRGVNFVPSDCVNFVDQWQEYGFEERLATADRELALAADTGFNTVRLFLSYEVWLYEREGFLKRFDRYLDVCARHGIRAIVVLFNDCASSKENFFLKRMGDQLTVYKGLGVRARSPHTGGPDVGYNILDIPEHAEKLCAMAEELIRLHAHDKRILFWNVMNEPGYNNHGNVAAPWLRRLFEIGWKVDPDQPLAADLFGTLGRGKSNLAENVAAARSDIVSYHCYRDFAFQVQRIDYLRRRFGRPLVNTEWMNRITDNRFAECYPLFCLERVGAVSWGLVRSRRHPSSSEPWPSLWTRYEKGEGNDLDFTQWMHDIFRPSYRPYDPRETDLIRRFNRLADEDGQPAATAARTGPWPKEKAWAWYNAQPWMRGCNYMPASAANFTDMWQEYGSEARFAEMDREFALAEKTGFNVMRFLVSPGVWMAEHDGFMARFERCLALLDKHKMRAIVMLGNDCSGPKELWKPFKPGPQHTDWGYHGGKKVSEHGSLPDAVGYTILDDPELNPKFYAMCEELVTKYRADPRVAIWNLWNEPGNNNRGRLTLPHLRKLFELCWKINPIQPLAADVWCERFGMGFPDDTKVSQQRADREAAQKLAGELSDIISYHCYEPYERQVTLIRDLRRFYGRPLVNTEWLARIRGCNVADCYPLFYVAKVGAVNWGFVAGRFQTYEPWEGMWKEIERGGGKQYDMTKWFHDLFRPSHRPYDPKELDLIKRFNKLADEAHNH